MIAHLQGNLIKKSPVSVIVDVNGVGYRVFITLPTYYGLPDTGARISLNIHTHIREEELKLFGFATELEQRVFEKLIGISKVGPKLAVSILSGMPVEDFTAAIMNKDLVRLTAIPGVGGKTAERLALEMKDRLKDLMDLAPANSAAPAADDPVRADTLSALANLGYKKHQAEKALNAVADREGMDLERLIRECLKLL